MRQFLGTSIAVLLFISSILFIQSCKKEEVPTLATSETSNVTGTSVTSGGTITSEGSGKVIARGVCWSTGNTPTIADKKTSDGVGAGTFSSDITELNAARTYFVRAYATNSYGTGYGNQVSITTYPTLSTGEITNLSSTAATSGGNITTDKDGLVTSRGVCWGTAQYPTVDDNKTIDGKGTGSFLSSITGLKPSTLYYVRAYATNSAGTAYGNQLTFQTPYDVLLTKENCILSGGSIISTFDGGHIVFGYIYKNIPNSTLIDWLPYLIKLDSLDNRIWETEVSFNFITNYQYSDILETIDHKIAFCYKSNVVLLDENGNILWKFEYKTSERYGCSSLVESDDNNLFVLASDGLRTAFLKISMNGMLLWEKVIKDGNSVNYNVGHLLCKIDNGNYFLAGYSRIDLHQRIWVAEISSTGEIVWENTYIDTYELSHCRNMIKTKDGGIIITGYSIGDLDIKYARVLKLDYQHKLIWEKSYFWDIFSNDIYSIIQDSNSDYVFCGTQGYQRVRAVLAKLDVNGNELWKRTYWPEDKIDYRCFFGDLLQISNGGYILVGTNSTLWGEAMPEGIWIKKVDNSGY